MNNNSGSKAFKPRIITEQFLADYFNISLEEAALIHTKLQRLKYGADDTIVTIGDAADGLYFIEDGQATVFNADGEAVNEMKAGQFFGEYAILADAPRLSTVKAHGKVIAYRMLPEDFLEVVSKHPKITGRLLKQVYGQISSKHTRLVSMTKKSRGLAWSPAGWRDTNKLSILVTYGITIAFFLVSFLLSRHVESPPVWWSFIPAAFLMCFTLWTKRILEGMALTIILLGGMLYRGNFVLGFGELMIEGIGNPDTASTILIMGMVEAFAALLASAGVVSAFKKLVEKHASTKSDSMFFMLLIMIAVCIDESLNVLTAGYCLNPPMDKQKIPREHRALLGSCSTALCSMIPFSLWGAYIYGWLALYPANGRNLFLHVIPFNFVGIAAYVFALMLCFGRFPKSKQILAAYKRVEDNGKLWPKGSEKYFELDTIDDVVGRPINLLLPMLVWILSSIIFGILRNPGRFALDAVSGLLITLIFMFILYISQRLMTPKQYFETLSSGIGNALMPILLLVFAERIAACLIQLGFDVFLEQSIQILVGDHMFLIPMAIYIISSLITLCIGSCWGMYGLGIPITVYLARRLGLYMPLCLGAVLAAGIIGECLCPYIDETSPIATSIGCEPKLYMKLRLQYWIPISLICAAAYLVFGLIFC